MSNASKDVDPPYRQNTDSEAAHGYELIVDEIIEESR